MLIDIAVFQNKRIAKTMTVSFCYLAEPTSIMGSRACPLHRYDDKKMADTAYTLLQKLNTTSANQAEWLVKCCLFQY